MGRAFYLKVLRIRTYSRTYTEVALPPLFYNLEIPEILERHLDEPEVNWQCSLETLHCFEVVNFIGIDTRQGGIHPKRKIRQASLTKKPDVLKTFRGRKALLITSDRSKQIILNLTYVIGRSRSYFFLFHFLSVSFCCLENKV